MGEIYADLFTNSLQGEKFWQFWAMIHVISESTLDVYMSCPKAIAKVTSHDIDGQNNRQTLEIATAGTDASGGMFINARRGMYTDT